MQCFVLAWPHNSKGEQAPELRGRTSELVRIEYVKRRVFINYKEKGGAGDGTLTTVGY